MISMTVRYEEVLGPLREAYDARAAWRDGLSKEPWKLAERQAFRERLIPGTRVLEMSWTSTLWTSAAVTGSSR
jgi:hypothetical protein